MEPVTIIVAALAAGAAAALKSTAEQAINDLYAGFKALIQRKYGIASVEALERKPDSEAKRTSVTEDLTDAGAGDERLRRVGDGRLRRARRLVPAAHGRREDRGRGEGRQGIPQDVTS